RRRVVLRRVRRLVHTAGMAPRRGLAPTPASGLTVLQPGGLDAAEELCRRDLVGSVLAATRLEVLRQDGAAVAGGEVWAYERRGQLVALCWSGSNMVPVGDDPQALDAFAEHARAQGRRCSSIVGPRDAVLGL